MIGTLTPTSDWLLQSESWQMNEGVENKAVEPPRPLYRFHSLIDEHSPRKRKISSSTFKQSKIPTLLVLDCCLAFSSETLFTFWLGSPSIPRRKSHNWTHQEGNRVYFPSPFKVESNVLFFFSFCFLLSIIIEEVRLQIVI